MVNRLLINLGGVLISAFFMFYFYSMKWGNLVLPAAGIALIIFLMQKKPIDLFKINVTGGNFDFNATKNSYYTSVYININLLLQNASKIPVNVTGGQLNVYFSKNLVGTASIPSGTITSGDNQLTLPFAIPSLRIFTTISNAIAFISNPKPTSVNIIGEIYTSLGTIPVNKIINIG